MKVKQLKDLLETFNEDSEVFYYHDDSYNTTYKFQINSAFTDNKNNVCLSVEDFEKENKETD